MCCFPVLPDDGYTHTTPMLRRTEVKGFCLAGEIQQAIAVMESAAAGPSDASRLDGRREEQCVKNFLVPKQCNPKQYNGALRAR